VPGYPDASTHVLQAARFEVSERMPCLAEGIPTERHSRFALESEIEQFDTRPFGAGPESDQPAAGLNIS
jgi:hypothetical protein